MDFLLSFKATLQVQLIIAQIEKEMQLNPFMVSLKIRQKVWNRVHPRFFDQVGHETNYASSGNKHFFNKSCHRRPYQNYEHPPQTSQNSYLQSNFFCIKKMVKSFKKNSMKNIGLGDQLL